MKSLSDIINLDYETFVKELKDLIKDPKIQSVISNGKNDGKPNDEKIKFSKGNIPANQLHPTQKQLIFEKSIKWSLIGKDIKTISEIKGGGPVNLNNTPIVTLNDKYIIDGHHRWIEAYLLNPDCKVVVYNMTVAEDPIDVLKIVQLAIAATTKEIPFSNRDGSDIYKIKEKDFVKLVDENVDKKVLTIFAMASKEFGVFLWDRVIQLRKLLPPAKGAPNREYMPQPGKAKGYDKKLQSGEINYKPPFMKESLKENKTFTEFVNEGLSINAILSTVRNTKEFFESISRYEEYASAASFKIEPSEINDGYCAYWSVIASHMLAIRGYDSEVYYADLEPRGIESSPGHWFVKVKGLYYDAETINGVKTPNELIGNHVRKIKKISKIQFKNVTEKQMKKFIKK